MKLQLKLLHEEDLFAPLNDLRQQASALTQIKSCNVWRLPRESSERGPQAQLQSRLPDRLDHAARRHKQMRNGTTPMNTRPTLANPHRPLAGLLFALTLLAASSPPAYAEDELGRLFFTPERRQILDRQRELNIQETQAIPEEPTFTINGVVTLAAAANKPPGSTAYLRMRMKLRAGFGVSTNRKQPGKVVVHTNELPLGNTNVGDTINRNTGEATDLLNGGSIKMKHSPNPSKMHN